MTFWKDSKSSGNSAIDAIQVIKKIMHSNGLHIMGMAVMTPKLKLIIIRYLEINIKKFHILIKIDSTYSQNNKQVTNILGICI